MKLILTRSGVVLLLLVLISACSVVRLTYGLADSFALRELDQYLDLNASQRSATKADLEALLAWHRSQELPIYADVMRQLIEDVRQPATSEQVDHYYDQLIAARTRTLDYLQDPAVRLLVSLSPEQAQHLRERLDEDRAEWLEEQNELSPEEAFEEYYEELLDNAEDWFGDFSESQQQQLNALARTWWQEQLERDAQREDDGDSEAWRERWLTLLGSGANSERIVQELRVWREYWLEPQTPERLTAQQQRRQRQSQRILDFFALLNQQQRDHASAKLQDYLESIEALIAS